MLEVQPKEIYLTVLENLILRALKKPTIFFIDGKRGSGKTDLALLVAEIGSHYGVIGNTASNIKVFKTEIRNYEHITNLEDLTQWCQNREGRKLFILDEAGKAVRRRTPMSKLNIEVLDNIQILRKYKLSIAFIAPGNTFVDSAIFGTDVLDIIISKLNNENPKVGVWRNLVTEEEVFFTDIPRAASQFDTYDIAPFTKNNPNQKSRFTDENLSLLWEWANGATYKSLGVHNMEINRKLRRFVKTTLEKELHSTP